VGSCAADGWAGVGVVVGPDAAGVVFGVQPALELVQQLRQTLDEEDEFGGEPVELGRPGEGQRPRMRWLSSRTACAARSARSRWLVMALTPRPWRGEQGRDPGRGS
jgi:hypothetical protein